VEPLLWIDHFEPDEMEGMLAQSLPVIKAPINSEGQGDYFWVDPKDNRRQWERKQVAEALGDLDKVEEQLNRELATCEELTLVVEGVMLPTPDGIQIFRLAASKTLFHQAVHIPPADRRGKINHPQPGLWTRWQGVRRGLIAAGIEVIETPNLEGTAAALVSAVKASFKEEHTTLRRYLRPHIPPFHTNEHIDNLARLKGTGVGPELAAKLIDKYHTFYDAVTATPSGIAQVIGSKRAQNFLEALGRYES